MTVASEFGRKTMSSNEIESPTGRDLYAAIYDKDLEAEAQWLRMGATGKSDSVGLLLHRNRIKPKTILELGCGTGEVIKECQRRGYGDKYTAIDYSEKAIEYLRANSNNIDATTGDITSKDFTISGHFDVVILSHVLEHLEEPAVFLKALRRIDFTYLIAEVPLEDLFVCRLKSLVKDRTRNPAGHVQFFTGASFRKLLTGAGLEILDTRRYASPSSGADLRFMCDKNNWGQAKYLQVLITGRYLPLFAGPLWRRLYYANFAALCRKGA
jgi:SAM-dependent methyltransferase